MYFHTWTLRVAVLALGLALMPLPHAEEPLGAAGLRFERIAFNGTHYDVIWLDTRHTKLELFWKRPDGAAFRNFSRLRAWLEGQDRDLLFAMNAGIYARDLTPLGLHIAEGDTLRELNTGPGGRGNFFLQPNGVFFLDESGAHVLSTEAYEARAPQPSLATQSGPMLVLDGELHPRFLVDGTSKNIRNGVGVRGQHEVAFVISRAPVNFHDFGSFFRDVLACPDALYLDGSISGMYAPQADRHDVGLRYVGMLAVTAPREE